MAERLDIAVIGPGVVGESLARMAYRAGYRVAAVGGGSHPDRAAALAQAVGGAVVLPMSAAAARGQLVLLTVADDAIEPVCRQLALAGGLVHRPIVAHCSGALGSEVLDAARQLGCAVGSMHPLQTFPNVNAAMDRLAGTYFFLEGDIRAIEALEALAKALGGHAVRISPQDKPLYHAAAVFCANYLTTLLDVALELYETIGLSPDEARQAMAPLVMATVHNVLTEGTEQVLTGPVARGDTRTIVGHIESLRRKGEEIMTLYRVVGRRTVEIALRGGKIDENTRDRLLAILDNPAPA